MRHLRAWWDVHRFRAPPQVDNIVREAERRGSVIFNAAHLCSVRQADNGKFRVELRDRNSRQTRIEQFDAIINCTGIDGAISLTANPFLSTLVRNNLALPDESGFGFAVDHECRPIGGNQKVTDSMRLFGSINAGTFGDSFGAIFIAAQIRRCLPGMLKRLGQANHADLAAAPGP